jgi:hypothetical protein
MALQKVSVPLPFGGGYSQKIDPKQIQIGKFQSLQNSVFNKLGLLQKRNGFGTFTSIVASNLSSLTTYSQSLVALGDSLNVFSEEQGLWLNRGAVNQVSLNTLSMVRSSTAQSSVDVSLAPNGLSCEVYVDSDGTAKYQVNDSVDGQILLSPVNLPTGAKSPRVFALNSYFIITYLINSAGFKLQYIALPLTNLSAPTSPTNISVQVKSDTAGYDGMVMQNTLYIAWYGSDLGGSIRQTTINNALLFTSTNIISGHDADLLTLSVNPMNLNIWITYWNSAANTAYTSILTSIGGVILAPTLVLSATVITKITSIVQNGLLTLAYEILNSYPSGIRSDYTATKTVTSSGTVSSQSTVLRSVGLASKLFIQNDIIYVMLAYNGFLQPTYFVSDMLGSIQAKLAYSNGGGYVTGQVLSNVSLTSNGDSYIGYQFKDLLLSASKLNASANSSGVYSQTGMNTVTLNFNTPAYSAEIGSNLNLTGGIVSGYDGVQPTEQGFNVWPEDITATPSNSGGGLAAQEYFYAVTYEWTDGQGNLFRSAPSIPLETIVAAGTPITFTSTFSSGVSSITVSSVAGLVIGQVISDTSTPGNIQVGTYITSINGLVIGLSLPTAGAGVADTLSTSDVGSVSLVIPTLRLTSKPRVRIVVYRWSTANQIFYQVSSIQNPTLNDKSIDTITYIDTAPDAAIVGNVILYTTGGVVENIAPPSTEIMTLFKSRLFLLDSEDRNLLWYSKQVIESTPVEMSDLFTIYVAPTIGSARSTGPITALGAMDDKLIVFKENAIYYITGNGPDNTGANNDFSEPIFIAGTVGCVIPNSIALIPNGLMFQSNKGIWLLDRNLNTSYIGSDVEDFTQNSVVLSSVLVPGTNQIRFTLNSGVTLMYDYFVGQWGSFTNIPGISSVIYAGLHTYLRSDGSIFQETPDQYLDGSSPTLMSFTTAWIKITGLQGYQRAYQYYILGTYITPHILQVQTAYDYSASKVQADIIHPDNFSGPWGSDDLWGNSNFWGGSDKLEQWRVNLQQQKCQSIQITVNEQYDPNFGVPAGAGLTLSGINLIVGAKSGYPRLAPSRIAG